MDYFHKQLTWSKKMNKKAINLMYKILEENFKEIINIRETPLEIDKEFATDLTLITLNSNSIALRMRRLRICGNHRDLTIQTQQASGNRHNTEYVKIFEKGYVKWYLYCWAKKSEIKEWMFIDLDKLRERSIIEEYNELTNKNDGQHFIAIPFEDLLAYGSILDSKVETTENLLDEIFSKSKSSQKNEKREPNNEISMGEFF